MIFRKSLSTGWMTTLIRLTESCAAGNPLIERIAAEPFGLVFRRAGGRREVAMIRM